MSGKFGLLTNFGLLTGFLVLLGFLTQEGESVSCYKCNSEYDPRCGDPFENFTIGVVNCSMLTKPEHLSEYNVTLCRKSVQKVYGKIRVVRGCGWIEDKERDNKACMRRTGTHDVFIEYCSCTSELCNNAYLLSQNIPLMILTLCVGISLGVISPYKLYETFSLEL